MACPNYVGRRIRDYLSKIAPYAHFSGLRVGMESDLRPEIQRYSWFVSGEDKDGSTKGRRISLDLDRGTFTIGKSGKVCRCVDEVLEALEGDLVCSWDF